MVAEPAYTFELPSLEDDTVLSARIYHPQRFSNVLQATCSRRSPLKGAVVAHPYAPLGGSYDDHVVLSVTETLLERGFVVATFNFRGSGDSQGRTSWTGQGEINDYVSIVGCLIHYLQNLSVTQEDVTSSVPDTVQIPYATVESGGSTHLLLAGYSYGSLVLARIPPLSTIVDRFEKAVLGTTAAEIILRARTLAKQTKQSILVNSRRASSPRGRASQSSPGAPTGSGRARASTVTVGGEESDQSQRRRSGSRRNGDIVRRSIEAPQRIVAHVRRQSGGQNHANTASEPVTGSATISMPVAAEFRATYLLISPVLLPFTGSLLPPGATLPAFGFRHTAADNRVGAQFLQHPTLLIFGTKDSFSHSRRLSAWAEKQSTESSPKDFQWEQVEGASHFWREQFELHALQTTIDKWVQS